MISIKCIHTIKEKPNEFLVVFKNDKVHYYVSKDSGEVVKSLENAMKQAFSESIEVIEISEQAALKLRVKPYEDQIVIRKHSVEKIKGEIKHTRSIFLSPTEIIEYDDKNHIPTSIHKHQDVHCLIRYPSYDLFGIQYKNDKIYQYKSSDRDLILLNLQEICENIAILSEEPEREGEFGVATNPEYAEHLFAKMMTIDDHWRVNLKEFISTFGPNDCPCKDKQLMRSLLKFVIKEDEPDMILLLSALYRLIPTKTTYEDLYHIRESIQNIILPQVYSKNPYLSYLASLISMEMVTSHSTEINVSQNQAVVFSDKELKELTIFKLFEKRYDVKEFQLWVHSTLLMFQRLFTTPNEYLLKTLVATLFEKRSIMYKLIKSDSIAISTTATRIFGFLFLSLSEENHFVLQNEMLKNGIIIFVLYRSIFSNFKKEKDASLKTLDLMASFNVEALKLLTRIIPVPFFKSLIENQIIWTETKGLFSSVKKKTKLTQQGYTEMLRDAIKREINSAELIWNQKTLWDLHDALEAEMKQIQNMNTWNFIEFFVNYPSLKDEIMVDEYYVKYLSDEYDRTVLQTKFDPNRILVLLIFKFLSTDEESTRLLCVKAMSHIYVTFLSENHQKFPYFEYLAQYMQDHDLTSQLSFEMLLLFLNVCSIHENLAIRHEKLVLVLLEYLKDMNMDSKPPSDLTLASLSLNILLKLANSRPMKYKEGMIMRPIPNAILTLSNHIDVLLNILYSQFESLSAQIYPILIKILEFNDLLLPVFYKTGFFYIIFSDLKRVTPDAISLIKMIHEKQEADVSGKSHLTSFWPTSLILTMSRLSSEAFTKMFLSDQNSPTLIWNDSLRSVLEKTVSKHFPSYYSNYQYSAMSPVVYQELEDQLFVQGLYISNLLLPENANFKITDPNSLFLEIVQLFSFEKESDHLETLILAQVFLIMKHSVKPQKYAGFAKCIEILGVYDKPNFDCALVESCIGLVFLCIKYDEKEFVALNGHQVLISLLSSLFRRRDDVNVKMFQIIFETLKLVTSVDLTKCDYDLENFYLVIMYCIAKFDSVPLYTCVFDYLIKLSNHYDFVKILSSKGFVYFCLMNLFRTEKVEISWKLICAWKNNKNFSTDLHNLLPSVLLEEKHFNLPNFLTDTEDPDLIWNSECRNFLLNHVALQCEKIKAKNFVETIIIQPIQYPLYKSELLVSGIFLRIYNLNVHKNWQPKDGVGFMLELIDKLSNESMLPLVIPAICNLLQRTKEKNLIVNKISNLDSIPSLFSVITNNKLTSTHLMSLAILCREISFFSQMIHINVLHELIPCLRLDWANLTTIQTAEQTVRLEETLEFLKMFSGNAKFVQEMNLNGILMYLVMITFGMYPIEEKLRTKASLLIGDFCEVTKKEDSTYFILSKVLPLPMCDMIREKSSNLIGFIEGFNETPEIIWKESMLKELKRHLINDSRNAVDGQWVPKNTIEYVELRRELYLTIFVRIYNEDKKFSSWMVKDGTKFLSSCAKSLIEVQENPKVAYSIIFAMTKCLSTQPEFASSSVFLECTNTLFAYLSDKNSMEIIVKTCQLLHMIIISNQDFVKKIVSEKLQESLIQNLNPNNIEIFLCLLLVLKQNSSVGFDVFDPSILFNLWNQWSNKAIRQKIEFLIKASDLQGVPEEIKLEIDELTLPPKDAPFTTTQDLNFAVQYSLRG